MNKVKAVVSAMSFSLLAGASFSSAATMDPYVENALINVCKSATTNSLLKYNKTAKSYHLKDKTIAEKVMCNGQDIADFARSHGSYKVAHKLERSLSGNVNIKDIAAIEKINVTFTL